jgi:hypothetical protein
MQASPSFRVFAALSYLLILLLAAASPVFSDSLFDGAQAAGGCSTAGSPVWDGNVANATLEYTNWEDDYWGGDYEESNQGNGGGGRVGEEYVSSSSIVNRVSPLTEGFHLSKVVANGTSSGIRINLTTGYTYTFCITSSAHNSTNSVAIDVYLMTGTDWRWYETSYSYAKNGWAEEFDMSDVPPEWRGGFYWRPYRDVHAYEDLEEITFSTSLDHLEYRTEEYYYGSNMLVYDEFYLIIDGWDNGRDSDAVDPDVDIDVDITIMVEERVMVPSWTVTLVCMGVMITLLAVPLIIHKKYHAVGLEEVGTELMPSLHTAHESAEKDYSVLE